MLKFATHADIAPLPDGGMLEREIEKKLYLYKKYDSLDVWDFLVLLNLCKTCSSARCAVLCIY